MKTKRMTGAQLYLLVLILLAALYLAWVFPNILERTRAMQEQHRADTQKIELYMAQAGNFSKLRSTVEELKQELAGIQKEEALSAQQIGTELDTALRRAGVRAENISVEETEQIKKGAAGRMLCRVPVSVTLNGTPAQVETLTRTVEQDLKGAYYVENLSFQTRDATNQLTMRFMFYYYEPAQNTEESTASNPA